MDNTTGRKLIYSIRFRLILVISDIHSMPKGGISRCPIYNDNGSEIQETPLTVALSALSVVNKNYAPSYSRRFLGPIDGESLLSRW